MILRSLLLLVFAVVSCGEGPVYPVCDYCRAPRPDAAVYPCRECQKTHYSCRAESRLRAIDARKDKEGVAIGRSIKSCPKGENR
jgi:hypothetical protein